MDEMPLTTGQKTPLTGARESFAGQHSRVLPTVGKVEGMWQVPLRILKVPTEQIPELPPGLLGSGKPCLID